MDECQLGVCHLNVNTIIICTWKQNKKLEEQYIATLPAIIVQLEEHPCYY
jgi:hypothetical protein